MKVHYHYHIAFSKNENMSYSTYFQTLDIFPNERQNLNHHPRGIHKHPTRNHNQTSIIRIATRCTIELKALERTHAIGRRCLSSTTAQLQLAPPDFRFVCLIAAIGVVSEPLSENPRVFPPDCGEINFPRPDTVAGVEVRHVRNCLRFGR